MQRRELSRSPEGENQKSDQMSTRREGSSKSGHIRDHMEHQFRLHDQQQPEAEQRKRKSSTIPEMELQYNKVQKREWDSNNRKAIQEIMKQRDGKTSSGSGIRLGFKKEGLRGGMHPKNFLTDQEKQDYDDAPDSPRDRTHAQNNAVYLYNRARKFIDKGWDFDDIQNKLTLKRIKRGMLDEDVGPSHHQHETFEKRAIDFLTEEEKEHYRQASDDPDDWTYKERRACRLFNHAYDLKEKGHSDANIADAVNDLREELKQEIPSPHQSDSDSDSDGIDWGRKTDIQRLVDKLVESPNDWYNKNPSLLPSNDIRRSILDDRLSQKEWYYARKYIRETYDWLSAESDNKVLYLVGAYYS